MVKVMNLQRTPGSTFGFSLLAPRRNQNADQRRYPYSIKKNCREWNSVVNRSVCFIIWNSKNWLVSLLYTSVCEYDAQSVLLCRTSKVFQCRTWGPH